jgi:hypothetical protein
MMKFECKELGTHCPYVAEGNSLEEVKKNAKLISYDAQGEIGLTHATKWCISTGF